MSWAGGAYQFALIAVFKNEMARASLPGPLRLSLLFSLTSVCGKAVP
jgi:hypothetical protein